MKTKQELFDYTTRQIIAQGGPSVVPLHDDGEGVVCQYRSPDGTRRCAAGWLIEDDDYDPGFEGLSWAGVEGKLAHKVGHDRLVLGLQRAHDRAAEAEAEPDDRTPFFTGWKHNLELVALGFNLDTSVLNEIPQGPTTD